MELRYGSGVELLQRTYPFLAVMLSIPSAFSHGGQSPYCKCVGYRTAVIALPLRRDCIRRLICAHLASQVAYDSSREAPTNSSRAARCGEVAGQRADLKSDARRGARMGINQSSIQKNPCLSVGMKPIPIERPKFQYPVFFRFSN